MQGWAPKSMLFQDVFLGTLLVDFMLPLCENCQFEDPFKTPVGAKMGFEIDQTAPKVLEIRSLVPARASQDPTGAQTAAQSTPRLDFGRL